MNIIACGRAHSDAILVILNEAIENSTALYDYLSRTTQMMASWFAAKERGNYPVIGAVDENARLLGFATYGPFRNWPAYKRRTSKGRSIGGRSIRNDR